jgi:hypothetical protein
MEKRDLEIRNILSILRIIKKKMYETRNDISYEDQIIELLSYTKEM